MNEVEYILRIVLKARDELATALRKAREELRRFADSAESNQKKIDAFNKSIEAMDKNVTNITDKFREWRAVIEGTGRGNADAKKSFGELGREVDSASKATQRHATEQERAAKAQDTLLKSADKLRNEYKRLQQQEAQSDKDRGYALFRLKAIGSELERISKRVDDPKIRKFYFDWAQDSKRAADSIINDAKRIDAAAEQAIKNEAARATQRQKNIDRQKEQYEAFTRARISMEKIAAAGKGGLDFGDRGEAERVVTVLKKVATQYKDTSRSAQELRAKAVELSQALRTSGRDADRASSIFSKLAKSFSDNENSVASFDNRMRGLGILLAVGFAQQLITVLGGLAGAFTAVAGSAAYAGTAIGGMFVAGVGQALPALGLLGAALFRVKSVMDAVQQAQLTEQQNAVQAATAHRRVADSADTLREAQERLSQARKDATRDLQDLILAEKEAELAARGAALSQAEAQEALRQAVASGDVGGTARAELGVLEANLDAEDKLLKAKRARADADKAVRGGPEAMPGVTQAAQQLETARRNAQEAAEGTETAVAKLNFMLAQLSPAERRLYQGITNIQRLFREGVYRDITDVLINSFARSVEKISDIIQMPKVIQLAQRTARTLAAQLNRVFDGLTTDKILDQLVAIGEAGRENFSTLATLAIRVGRILVNIAESAGPAFSTFLEFVTDLVGQFLKLTENRRGMEEFFETGEKHLEAWVRLGVAIIEFFFALAGAGGAQTGLRTVEDATKAVDGLTEKIRDNAGKVGEFFEDSRKILYEVVGVLEVLAIELYGAFTPERVENFATLLKEVVIPALGDVIEFMGDVTQKLVEFADTPIGGELLKGIVIFYLLKRVYDATIGAMVGVLFRFGRGAVEVLGKFKPLADFFRGGGGLRVVKGVGIVGMVLLLLDLLGLLDDAWREVKSAFNAFWREVQPSVEQLLGSFKDLWEAVSEGKGLFGALVDVLRPILKVVIEIGGIFLRVFGRTLGRVVGGLIDILSGFLEFLTGVFTGDWRKAWGGIRRIFGGVIRAIGGILRGLPELLLEIGKKLLPALREGAESLWGWLEKLPNRLGNLAADAAKAFVGAFKNVGGDVIEGILSGLKDLSGFARDIANSFIDLLNQLLPNKIAVPGAPDINLPDNPIPRLAQGGPVPGSGRGDKIVALLEPEEHVWTRDEVAAAGGHAAMYAMRRYFGGGGQGINGRYQDGGAPQAAGGLTVTFVGGGLDDFMARWRQFWNFLVAIARRGTNQIEAHFRDMRAQTDRSTDRMHRDVRETLTNIQGLFKSRGARIVDSWSDMWMSLKKVAHEALFYIGHETNQALRGLGEKSINFGFKAPTKEEGKAAGGWIEGKGHRGRDRGLYPLGAGEAVLNWQHQSYVEPAMNAYYGHGLSDMFKRVRGYHAGDGGGYAQGGIVPIKGMPGESIHSSIAADVQRLIRQYKLLIYDGYAPTGHAAAGEHPKGLAIDAGPGPGGSWDLVGKLARFAEPVQNQPRKPWRWVGYTGDSGHGPGDHIHLSWLAGETLGEGIVTEIKKLLITGPGGALKTFVQAAVDKVRGSANAMIESIFGTPAEGAEDVKPGDVGPGAENIFKFFRSKGFTDAQAAAWVGNFMQESGLDPSAVQPNGEGHGLAQWGGGRFAALQAFAESNGKPWQDLGTQLAFVMHELLGAESAAYQAIKGASTLEEAVDAIGLQYERYGIAGDRYGPAKDAYRKYAGEFAEGGIVPGPEGAPRTILAHAAEWILNPGQVGRLANMLGTNTAALRSMMGFSGSAGRGYQGGGEVPGLKFDKATDAPFMTENIRKRLENIRKGLYTLSIIPIESWEGVLRESRRVFTALRAKARDRARDVATLSRLTGEGGVLDQLDAARERFSARLTRQLAFASFHFNRATRRVSQGRIDTVVETTMRELVNSRREMRTILQEESQIVKGLKRVNNRLRQLRRGGVERGEADEVRQLVAIAANLRERRRNIRDTHAQQLEKIFQAQIARQQAIADEITTRFEREGAGRELFMRISQALGDEGAIAKLNAAQRDMLTRQANELNARIAGARRAGAGELADQLAAQVADLRVQIFESIQQELRDAMDRINTRAQNRLGRLDLAGRMLDAVGAVGLSSVAGLAGERFTRGGVFAQRGAALTTQRAELQGVLRGAQAQRNMALVQELTDALAELEVSIRENTKAAFDARVEDVNNRASFALNINDLNRQITDLEGTIGGQIDQARITALLQERGNILADQRLQLERLLAEAQAAGNQQAVNDLTVALLENRVAILQNTQATNEATGALTQPQTFTSSAWTRFREAIFNGMGQVLPQYNPQNMMGEINTGAVIYPSSGTGGGISRVSGDTNINLYEAGRPVDLEEVSAAITFASKTSQ